MGFFDDLGDAVTSPAGLIGGSMGLVGGPIGFGLGALGGRRLEQQMRGGGGDKGVYMPQPGDPQYAPGYDPNTMSMTPELDRRLAGINVDQRGLKKFRGEALRSGPSTWARLANEQQSAEERNARQRAMSEAGAGGAQARSTLAMKGGLTSGARERAARDANKNYLMMSQDIGAQGTKNRGQISMNDEQNRITQLGQLPGMENQAVQNDMQKVGLWGQGRQIDTANATAETARRNDFNMGRYKEKMAAWGSNQQANATANSGKK